RALRARVERLAALAAARVGSDCVEVEDPLAAVLAAEHDGLVLIHSPAPRSLVARRARPGRAPAPRFGAGIHGPPRAVLAIVAHGRKRNSSAAAPVNELPIPRG